MFSEQRCCKQSQLAIAVSQSVSELDKRWVSAAVNCCYEKLTVEAGDSSETHKKRNVHC
jgi:hypothetical protein